MIEELLGKENDYVMNVIADIAVNYGAEDKIEHSLQSYQKIIKYFEKRYNSIHPELIEAYSNMAYILAQDE